MGFVVKVTNREGLYATLNKMVPKEQARYFNRGSEATQFVKKLKERHPDLTFAIVHYVSEKPYVFGEGSGSDGRVKPLTLRRKSRTNKS